MKMSKRRLANSASSDHDADLTEERARLRHVKKAALLNKADIDIIKADLLQDCALNKDREEILLEAALWWQALKKFQIRRRIRKTGKFITQIANATPLDIVLVIESLPEGQAAHKKRTDERRETFAQVRQHYRLEGLTTGADQLRPELSEPCETDSELVLDQPVPAPSPNEQ